MHMALLREAAHRPSARSTTSIECYGLLTSMKVNSDADWLCFGIHFGDAENTTTPDSFVPFQNKYQNLMFEMPPMTEFLMLFDNREYGLLTNCGGPEKISLASQDTRHAHRMRTVLATLSL